MKTVRQVSHLTGVSVRTLQFYDEIGLLKPAQVTDAGYRLYDEASLEALQQILFFKELDFTLKDIKAIMDNPQFTKADAYKKQRVLIELKRDRLDGLLRLLDKLEKGEKGMSFREFDMSPYYQVLDELRSTYTDEIAKKFFEAGEFDHVIADIKAREGEIAELAVRQYGSIEKYASAIKKNFEVLLRRDEDEMETKAAIEQTNLLTHAITADLNKDVSSDEIQSMVRELVLLCESCCQGIDMGENYWASMAENYLTNATFIQVTDQQFGLGASAYLGRALKHYLA